MLLGCAPKFVVCVCCALLPIWLQTAGLQRPVHLCLCTDMRVCVSATVGCLRHTNSPRWVCVRPAFSTAEEPEDIIWQKSYFGDTSRTEPKPPRLPVFDARLTEAWTSRNSPGSYLWSISTETRIMSQTCIVSWSLEWRQRSRSNHQESSSYWGMDLVKVISNFFFSRQVSWDTRTAEAFRMA